MRNQSIKVRVEFDPTPIRHLAIECPQCKNWFNSADICEETIVYDYELNNLNCICPKCKYSFSGAASIQECNSLEEVYKDVLTRKVEWVK